MITLDMDLIPWGQRKLGDTPLLRANIFTVPFGPPRHGYQIMNPEGVVLAEGSIEKTHSGHRNPLHLMRDILNDIDLDALGKDYIKTVWDE